MSDSDSPIVCSEYLSHILDIARSIKEHKVNDSRQLLAIDIEDLRLNLLDERHANFGNIPRILLPPLGKMVGTISNIEQSKQIVDASRKNIHKRNSLDGRSIPKKGQSKHTCFRHKVFICSVQFVEYNALRYFPEM